MFLFDRAIELGYNYINIIIKEDI